MSLGTEPIQEWNNPRVSCCTEGHRAILLLRGKISNLLNLPLNIWSTWNYLLNQQKLFDSKFQVLKNA